MKQRRLHITEETQMARRFVLNKNGYSGLFYNASLDVEFYAILIVFQ